MSVPAEEAGPNGFEQGRFSDLVPGREDIDAIAKAVHLDKGRKPADRLDGK